VFRALREQECGGEEEALGAQKLGLGFAVELKG
jgi:hypothetical protein